jgi:heat shock protein HslJ
MNDKKNLIIALLVIALAILAYVIWVDKPASQQSASNTETGQNNNITEPPPPPPAPTPTPNAQGPGDIAPTPADEKFADNNWLLVGFVANGSAVNMDVNVPAPMTLNFDKAKNTYDGFAGCNSFSGGYASASAGKFSFGATAATKKYCAATSSLENSLLGAMGKVTDYMITAEGNLVLKDLNGQTKIEYKPAV